MSTDSIFEDKNSGTPSQNPDNTSNVVTTPTDAEITNLLSGIKNERGEPKYKTLKDALVGLQNAQDRIPSLKQTLAERDQEIERLRKETERVANLEESVRKLTERTNDDGTPPKALSAQEIADLVNQSLDTTLTQREIVAQQKRNTQAVVETLQASFGADAEKKFYDKATELGMTVAEFNTLAAKSPKMVLNALGVTERKNVQSGSPAQGSINSQGFTPQADTFIGRNKTLTLVGATSQELAEESKRSNQMVEELHKQGKSVHDLTDPKVFFRTFG